MSHIWVLQWKFSHCIEGVSASISGSETTFPTRIERVNHNLRETGIFMTHALAGCGRRNVRDEDVLDIVHDNPTTSRHHISSATERLSQRAAWLTVRQNKLYPFPFTTSANVTAGYKYLHPQFFR
jgi:hypothetical protein